MSAPLSHATGLVPSQSLPLARVPPPPPVIERAALQAGVQVFSGQMIARMVVIGEIMLAFVSVDPPMPSA